MIKLEEKQVFIQKILLEKDKQFDNLMKYSLTADEKYLEEIEKFFYQVNEIDNNFNYKLFPNLLKDYNFSVSGDKSNTVYNLLNLYGKVYFIVHDLDKKESKEIQVNGEKRVFSKADNKILIIDDDVLLLRVIEDSMKSRGYSGIFCSEPLEALDCLREEEISLVILDMILPQIDGFKMTKLIRNIDPVLPIIIISGRDDLKTKINVLKIGADDYITKPINMDEFYARIDRTLARTANYNALSIEDGLTGAYTKEHFWDRISEKKALYDRNKQPFSIAFIDLDDFKEVNDNLGHLIGDHILRCFSKALKDNLRSTDLIFRFGGDEFIIIFPETKETNAKQVLERFKIQKGCGQCQQNQCPSLGNIDFSAGITEVRGVEDTVEEIIERADAALYQAKDKGKNEIIIYGE